EDHGQRDQLSDGRVGRGRGGFSDACRRTSGRFAQTHNVYLGISAADVNQASVSSPLGVLVSQGQDINSFDPGRLELGQTYYWRVDEVNGTADNTVFAGNIWSFTVEPYSYPIAGVTATASSATKDMGPDKTVDGSGLDEADRHSTTSTDMWLSAKGAEQPAWVQYEFSRAYKLDKMLVWNSNQLLEAILGVGAKGVTVEYSADGQNWSALGDFEFAQASASPDYTADTTVVFNGVTAKFVKLTISSNWGGLLAQYGLSEVRFYYVPVMAREPQPADDAADVNPQVTFSWRAGREAASHRVYVSDDQQAVIDGTASAATVSANEYETSLMFDKTYFWKVVEVNEAEATTSWDNEVWSFSTGSFVAVDDFEVYTDSEGSRIYEFWVDGFEDAANGSLVGYNEAPFAEQKIVRGGKQSMPLAYDNSNGAAYSEAKLTLDSAQDWTKHGITTLVVFFRGQSSNSAASVYARINDTKISFNNGAAATNLPVWKQWNIPLAAISGLKNVKSVSIGVEGSGTGTLFVDDIRLYATAPEVVTPADPGASGLLAWYKMDDNVQDSSGKNYNGTLTSGNYDVGLDGKALSFNGSSTYVDLPIGPAINTMTNMTIATQVNFSGGTGSWQRIFDFGSGTTTYMFLSPRQSTAGSMRFAIRTTAVSEQIVDSPAAMPTGWHHAAISIDSATMMMTLYLDGDQVAQAATTLLPKDLGNTTQNWLGRSQWSADAYFYGMLDEFRIYNRTLSAGEVKYLAGDR
ncbi:MAG: LamG-like jellyroll fold domain-containing protein, partial [Solirubrobacterales bacterium]